MNEEELRIKYKYLLNIAEDLLYNGLPEQLIEKY